MDLKKNAPKGEFLAYINKKEAAMLKKAGGSGKLVNGIPSFRPQDMGNQTNQDKSAANPGAGGGKKTGTTSGRPNPHTDTGFSNSNYKNEQVTGNDFRRHADYVRIRDSQPKTIPSWMPGALQANLIKKMFGTPKFNVSKKNIGLKRMQYINSITDPKKRQTMIDRLGLAEDEDYEEGDVQYGNVSTLTGDPLAMGKNLYGIDALDIINYDGEYMKQYGPKLIDNGKGEGNPNILPQYAMMGGGADMGSVDAEPYNEFNYDENAFGPGRDAKDVTLGTYNFNQGGRARRAEGGIMGTRARKAMGGIMERVDKRQGYFLGKLVKKVGKAAKKVLSSDIGKAAIIGAGIYYGGGGTFKPGGSSTFEFGNLFNSNNKLLFSANKAGKQVFNPLKMAGLITAGGALMGPAKQDSLEGFNNRGGSLIDPITGKPAKPAEMRASLNNALENADGDPVRIKQINDAYAFLGPDERLGTYSPYRTYGVKDGGRIGYGLGNLVSGSGMFRPTSASMSSENAPSFEGGSGMGGMIADLIKKNPNMFKHSKNTTPVNQSNNGMYSKMFNNSQGYFIDENMNGIDDREEVANGGRIGKAEGGLMDLGGMEKDYRAEGGFVPIGEYEKKDDVPARLSVNEFVFTADAVRGAGQGDIDKGAEIMENMMVNLEKGGTVSEESQGNAGAQQMFDTSERLGEVI